MSLEVYNPIDPLERSIQNAYHQATDKWLEEGPCQLVAKAMAALKMFKEDWLNNVALLDWRIQYFFAPYMTRLKDEMAFTTHLLFLRDILENHEIDGYLHDPIVFVTRPIAHYLMREFPVHIHLNMPHLRSVNPKVEFVEIGGLTIVSHQNIKLEHECILDIKTKDVNTTPTKTAVDRLCTELGHRKIGVSLRGPGVFTNDEHKREIHPSDSVWDKLDRQEGVITRVEPGETGIIEVSYADGASKLITQEDFDSNFIIT